MMIPRKTLVPILLLLPAFFISACVYIVLPAGLESPEGENADQTGWTGIVTNVGETDIGGLRVDLSIRNDTGDWNTMHALADKPAVLTTADGERINCDTVFVGTGGHRVAPGFQIRGYTSDESGQEETQRLYIACDEPVATAGATLAIDYLSFGGELDYYTEENNQTEGRLELNLDEVVTELTYPVAVPVEGLIQDPGIEIVALSDNVISLVDVQRSQEGFQFTWQNFNPSKFPLKTHIGIPPVVGEDGIIYGVFETQDMSEVPLTLAGESIQWNTEVMAPEDVGGFYILLSVESNKPRTYLSYAIDITDK